MTWFNKGLLLTTSAAIALSTSACATFPGRGIQSELNDTSREVAQTEEYRRPSMGHGVQQPIGANAFWMTVDDYISEVSLPNNQFQMANIGELDVEGYEASVHYGIGPWDLLATYAHAETDESGLVGDNDGSLRDTGDQLGLGATYTFDAYDIVLDYGIQVIMDQDVPGGEDKPGYMVQNISARWNEPFDLGGFSVLFAVDNLLDETYTSHASRTGETVHPRLTGHTREAAGPPRFWRADVAPPPSI